MKLFVVIGLGQFGRYTATTLYEAGCDVIAIDKDENRVEVIKDEVGQAICADATNIETLRSIGVDRADTAIVALGEDELENSIICCTALSDLAVGRIIVRCSSELHGKILLRIGASKIIYPEKQMGEQLAKSLINYGTLDQVFLSTGQVVAFIKPRLDLLGKSFNDIKINERYRLALIGVQKPLRRINDKGELIEELSFSSMPSLDNIIEEEDILVLVGHQNQIDSISRKE